MTRAASRMNVVQPALSMQMAKLESEIGQQLFHRNTRGLAPAPAGHLMYKLFRPLLAEFAQARDQLMQTHRLLFYINPNWAHRQRGAGPFG